MKATELQGRAIGMFAQQHQHRHEHSVVPTDSLIAQLQRSNPVLASELGKHLGLGDEAVEGEYEVIEDQD